MAKASPSSMPLSLGEEWIARALEGIEIADAPRQVLAEVDDRTVCLNVVAAGDGSEDGWSRYSTTATRRASVTGDRLCPVVATGHMDDRFFVAYEIGHARAIYLMASWPRCPALLACNCSTASDEVSIRPPRRTSIRPS